MNQMEGKQEETNYYAQLQETMEKSTKTVHIILAGDLEHKNR
jgi:hypothetical protein